LQGGQVPRRPNPDLEKKILDAAQRLWKKGGEHALTMRAVAEAAGTNTPAVYRRFRDRDDILRGLLDRVRVAIAAELQAAPSPEQACERYIDYALGHPREYELFYQQNYPLNYSPRSSRAGIKLPKQPARDAMRRRLTESLGESADGHESLLNALWMLTHGAAMLLIVKAILPQDAARAREVFSETVRTVLNGAKSC
jgi:AcrR family transcriptional regulator